MNSDKIYDLVTNVQDISVMKFKDFITLDVDIDVNNDYSEPDYAGFSGACHLTEQGRDKYREILSLDVEVDSNKSEATVLLEDKPNAGKLYRFLADFFNTFAGDTSEQKWNTLFRSNENSAQEGITTDNASSKYVAYLIYKSFKRGYSQLIVGNYIFNAPDIRIKNLSLQDCLEIIDNGKVEGELIAQDTSIVIKSPTLPKEITRNDVPDMEIRLVVRAEYVTQDLEQLAKDIQEIWDRVYDLVYSVWGDFNDRKDVIQLASDTADTLEQIKRDCPNGIVVGCHSKLDIQAELL